MTSEDALTVLSHLAYDKVERDKVFNLSPYVGVERGDRTITLDGDFTADELEAFLAIMRPEPQKET